MLRNTSHKPTASKASGSKYTPQPNRRRRAIDHQPVNEPRLADSKLSRVSRPSKARKTPSKSNLRSGEMLESKGRPRPPPISHPGKRMMGP